MVITTSAALTNSSVSGLGNSWLMSIPISRIASTTIGLSSFAGVLPAERTWTLPAARWFSSPAAIWLRPAVCTHTNRTSGTCFSIMPSKLHASSKTVQDRDPGRQDVIELDQNDQTDADPGREDHAERGRARVQGLGDQDAPAHQVSHVGPTLVP